LVEVLPASDHPAAAGHVSAHQIATRLLDLVDAVLALDAALQDGSVQKALRPADQPPMAFLSSFRSPTHTEGLCNVALGVVMGAVFAIDPQRLDDDTIEQLGDAVEIALHGIDLKRLSEALDNEFQRAAGRSETRPQRV
jgi:hypothetical protein